MLSVLRLVLNIGETSSPYKQFSEPFVESQNITICTFFEPTVTPSERLTVHAGDGTVAGFSKTLDTALSNNEYDVIHCHTPHVGVILLHWLFRNRVRATPLVYTVHSSRPNYGLRNKLLMSPIFAMFDQVVFCGQASRQSFPCWWRWIAGKRQCTITNGIDLDRIDTILSRSRLGNAVDEDSDIFRIASVGRLVAVKNPSAILDAFRRCAIRASRLSFLGTGPLHDEIRSGINTMKLTDQVTADGEVSRDDVYSHLRNTDLFVSTSYIEGLPIATLEAMACRVPVILSDIPSHREIADGTTFIPLVAPNDTSALSREIRRMHTMPRSERREIGEKCRAQVERRFSLRSMQAKYSSLFRQLQAKCSCV